MTPKIRYLQGILRAMVEGNFSEGSSGELQTSAGLHLELEVTSRILPNAFEYTHKTVVTCNTRKFAKKICRVTKNLHQEF